MTEQTDSSALFDSSVSGVNPKGFSGVLRGLWMTSRSAFSHPSLCDCDCPPTVPNCHSHRSIPTWSTSYMRRFGHNLDNVTQHPNQPYSVSLQCPRWQFAESLRRMFEKVLVTHQCQAWQAVDAPHAGEREAGSLLAAHWRTATARGGSWKGARSPKPAAHCLRLLLTTTFNSLTSKINPEFKMPNRFKAGGGSAHFLTPFSRKHSKRQFFSQSV